MAVEVCGTVTLQHFQTGTNSTSLGSILATQQLRTCNNYSLTFPPSIARHSFIQLSELVGYRGANSGSLDCKSGILPLSYQINEQLQWPSDKEGYVPLADPIDKEGLMIVVTLHCWWSYRCWH